MATRIVAGNKAGNRSTAASRPAPVYPTQNIRGVASLTLEARDGVLYGQVKGLVTVAEEPEIFRRLAPAITDTQVVCIDYSKAVLAITASGLDTLFRAAPPGPSRLVIAWVVPDVETAALWRQQATRFALAGVRRFSTHLADEAREYARKEAWLATQREPWQVQHRAGGAQ